MNATKAIRALTEERDRLRKQLNACCLERDGLRLAFNDAKTFETTLLNQIARLRQLREDGSNEEE